MTLCSWSNEKQQRVCVAEALPDDHYCAAHRAIANGVTPRPRIDRREHQNADLLPLTPEEFQQLAELAKRSNRR